MEEKKKGDPVAIIIDRIAISKVWKIKEVGREKMHSAN